MISLHHESIYQYVLADKEGGGTLYQHLRHQARTFRKRYGSAHNRTGIPNRVDIDERPEVANQRQRVGDWEADTIIGKNHRGAIVTLDERQSKLRLAAPVPGKKAQAVKKAIIELLHPIWQFVNTITFDNGKDSHYMNLLPKLCHVRHISPNHTIHGKGGRMKMPMDYFVNTFPSR